MRISWLSILLGMLLWTSPSEAACSGSSPVWTAASPAQTEVAACVAAAGDGDTILVPAGSGSATWNGTVSLPNTKGLSIIGPGAANLTLTSARFNMNCSPNRPHRISGFRFTGSGTELSLGGTCRGFRIDHNVFFNVGGDVVNIDAGVALAGALYGLIDNNTFTQTGGNQRSIIMYSGGIEWGVRTNWPVGSRLAHEDNIYIEDNVFEYGNQNDPGSGAIDSNSGAAWVFRYNTVTNAGVKSHGVCASEGTVNQSVYGNRFVQNNGFPSGYRSIHMQGSGEAVYFDNRFTATGSKSGGTIEILHYRSADPNTAGCPLYPRCDGSAANSAWDRNLIPTNTNFGYRCRYQPGSKAGPNGSSELSPVYAWNNTWTDTSARVPVNIEDAWNSGRPVVQDHVKPDRDYYDAVSNSAQSSASSPFDGTTGMGFGTLANRPSTCSTNPSESGGGVGYWATDVGEWNSRRAGPDGQLYRCSATNTWTLHYMPFPYPHPMQSGVAIVRPEPPTDLQ